MSEAIWSDIAYVRSIMDIDAFILSVPWRTNFPSSTTAYPVTHVA